MAAYLRPDKSWYDRAADEVEKSWSKTFFIKGFCGGDHERAGRMSVTLSLGDKVRVASTAPFILGRFRGIAAASRHPRLSKACDAYTIRILKKRLVTYGTPEFTTDVHAYPTG